MQTFMPYPDVYFTAKVLDRRRLGKQRVEVLQILNALEPGSTSGWQQHPAVRMWRGHAGQLAMYGVYLCREWVHRGYHDTTASKIQRHLRRWADAELEKPPWLGDEALHLSHRSNLVRKDPNHYGAFFPDTPDDLPYVWPVGVSDE